MEEQPVRFFPHAKGLDCGFFRGGESNCAVREVEYVAMPMGRDKLGRKTSHQAILASGLGELYRVPSNFPALAASDSCAQCSSQQLRAKTDAKDWLIVMKCLLNEPHLIAQIRITIELINGFRSAHYDQPASPLHTLRNRCTVENPHVLPG